MTIKLCQETAFGDQVLACYTQTAREFLFPTPKLASSGYPGVDREVILARTRHYGGLLEPKLEFTSKTTIKEVQARLRMKHEVPDSVIKEKTTLKPSSGTFRGKHSMSTTEPRWTHTTETNQQRATQSQRRARSPKRAQQNPPYMDSTVSFRAKSPERRKKTKASKPRPFLAGTDEHNMVNYARDYAKGEIITML